MSGHLEAILADVVAWSKVTFPQATPYSIAEHLRREAVELAAQPTNTSEIADVAILLAELADAVGVDLIAAISNKMAINRERTWGEPDADGVVEHVRERKPWDAYWLDVARLVATRATCPRASIGAVLVKFQRIIATGYNGVPSGEPHCPNDAEHMALDHCQDAIHAEINALANAFVPVHGAALYVVGPRPVCPNCRDALRQAGVTDIRWSAS